jgi:hypothetical protein
VSELTEPEKREITRPLWADQADNPNNADWAVNALAPAIPNSLSAALTVRAYDSLTEEGIGDIRYVPLGSSRVNMLRWIAAATAPPAARTVGWMFRYRRITPTPGAWASVQLADGVIPTLADANDFQKQTVTFTYASLATPIVADEVYQFEFTRVDPLAPTELVGDLLELGLRMELV